MSPINMETQPCPQGDEMMRYPRDYHLSPDNFIDYYAVLKVNPTASQAEIEEAFHQAVYEVDNDAELNELINTTQRISILTLLTTAYHLLTHPQDKLLYDIYRMSLLGELKYTPPTKDLPSLPVTLTRMIMVWDAHSKAHFDTLELAAILSEARDYISWSVLVTPAAKQECVARFDRVIDELRELVFRTHAYMGNCGLLRRYADTISDAQWAEGLRDPRTDANGNESRPRVELKRLQEAEHRIHRQFWPQIVDALASKALDNEDEYDAEADLDRIEKILSHLPSW